MSQTDAGSRPVGSPYTLNRVNPWRYRLLSASSTAAYSDAFAQLVRLDDMFVNLCTALAEVAHKQVAASSDVERRTELIRIRRRVRLGKIREEILAIDELLGRRVLDNRLERAKLVEYVDSLRAASTTHEVRELTCWASDSDVQDSLSMTSTSLSAAVIRLAEAGGLDRTARKSLPSFVQYHSRSIARVSPFSRYTAVRADFEGDVSEPDGALQLASCATTSRLLYRLLFRVVSADTSVRSRLRWKVSELIERDDERTRVHSRRPRGLLASRFEGVSEQTISVSASSPWSVMIDTLSDLDEAGETLRDICQKLALSTGSSIQSTQLIVDKLCAVGALVGPRPVSDLSENFTADWRAFLVDIYGSDHHFVALHDQTENTRQALPILTGRSRVAALDDLHERWTTALEPVLQSAERVTNDVLLEDSYLLTGQRPDLSSRATWESDTRALLPLLRAIDDHDVYARVVDNAFVELYGESGTCTTPLELAEAVAARVEKSIAGESGATSIHTFEHELPLRLRSAREYARALLARCVASPERSVVEIREHELHHLENLRSGCSLPGVSALNRKSTLAIHGQPAGDSLVVNHFYGGPGIYLSRFTAGLTPQQKEAFRAYVRRSSHAPEQSLQLSPVFGFNANLAPMLMANEFCEPNERPRHPATARHISEFRVQRRAGVLRFVENSSGADVDIRYFGFLVPFVMPSLERMLTAYWGASAVSLDHLDSALLEQLQSSATDVVAAPELRFRSLILARRRWAMFTSVLVRLLSDPERAFIELNTWRAKTGLPSVVFLKPLGARAGGGVAGGFRVAKPTLIDFHSHLHVSTLRKRLDRFPVAIVLETLTPDPEASGLVSDAGRHAAELYFEVDYESDGARRLQEDPR